MFGKLSLGVTCFIITWSLLAPQHLHARQALPLSGAPLDSLEAAIFSSEGTDKVDVLNALSWSIKFSNPTRSYLLANQAHELSKSLSYPLGIVYAIKHMGIARTNQGRYREALSLIFEEIEMRKDMQDTLGIAVANNNIGYILRQQKNYDLALEYFRRSLELSADAVHIPNVRALTLNSVGHIYRMQGNYDKSEQAHLESLEVLDEVKRSDFARATTLNNLGKLYLEQDQYRRALRYFFAPA
ncbi:MAG: tetratricopeptide repeat protein [Bacteroidota bacterium]